MMRVNDSRDGLNGLPMTATQIIVVILTVLLNAMDGFDILSIAFAGPGIAKEWGINPLALGIVLSMELIGMAIGSLTLGSVADRLGRRPMILACLVLMGTAMLLATTAASPLQLAVWRLLTGFGIGGMLSSINAVVAEFSNDRWRGLCLSMMVIGNPLGGGIGGLYASSLIAHYDWRAVFYLGAAAAAVLLPVTYWLMPESVPWLLRKQPPATLARVNRSLQALGHSPIAELPEIPIEHHKSTLASLFTPAFRSTTLLVAGAFVAHFLSFYYLLKWAPKIATDLGFAASAGGRILTIANLGGAAGGALFGVLVTRVGLKRLSIGTMLLNTVAIVSFGRAGADLQTLTWVGVVVGFFGNAGVSGLFSLAAYAFPADLRASGTGLVIGAGRAGAIASPWLAGYLFETGGTPETVATVMAAGSLVAAATVAMIGSSRSVNVLSDAPVTSPHPSA